MISSIWPMPQNLKVSKNEISNPVENIQSTQDSSVTNDVDLESFFTSKQEFIIKSNLDPKIKDELKTALHDLAKFINFNQLKGTTVQLGFSINEISKLQQIVDQSQEKLNYDPKGKIPFPKKQSNNFMVGSFDLDDPF